jgi:signal transduction histidine kinase
MNLNPLNTLAGRLVLVTIVAVMISYAVAFVLFANERGASLRRAAEVAAVERIAYAFDALRAAPADQRPELVRRMRDYGIRYQIESQPSVSGPNAGGAGARMVRALSEELGGAEMHARTRTVELPSRHWRELRRERLREQFTRLPERGQAAPPLVRITEVNLAIALPDGDWLGARVRLPGPRPIPISLIVGGLISLIVVGIGATFVSLQVGRPLAQLADAASALGAGESNVTAPVSGPEDVRRASTAFNAMAARLGRHMNRQRQMLWALSHDLRTPITALRLRAELIEDEPARQRLLAPIAEMEALTEQALSLARAGASEETRVELDLAEIARTLCGELEELGVNVRANAPTPVTALVRPNEIARAMRNLAENADRYGNGGTMRVARADNGEAIIEVFDDGPGVPPDMLSRLAEPFFRADAARSGENGDGQKGAGLGLAIAQAIADGHGGRLVLENRMPHGLSAKIMLPR